MGKMCGIDRHYTDPWISGGRDEMLTWKHLQDLDREVNQLRLVAQLRPLQPPWRQVPSLISGIISRLAGLRLHRLIGQRDAQAHPDVSRP